MLQRLIIVIFFPLHTHVCDECAPKCEHIVHLFNCSCALSSSSASASCMGGMCVGGQFSVFLMPQRNLMIWQMTKSKATPVKKKFNWQNPDIRFAVVDRIDSFISLFSDSRERIIEQSRRKFWCGDHTVSFDHWSLVTFEPSDKLNEKNSFRFILSRSVPTTACVPMPHATHQTHLSDDEWECNRRTCTQHRSPAMMHALRRLYFAVRFVNFTTAANVSECAVRWSLLRRRRYQPVSQPAKRPTKAKYNKNKIQSSVHHLTQLRSDR